MRIDFSGRRVFLSARELAEFRIGPTSGARQLSGRWRTDLGIAWHGELRGRAERESAGSPDQASFEIALQGVLTEDDWRLEVQGRVDQVLERADSVLLSEVKSVSGTLPRSEEELEADHPSYFCQAAVYALLAAQDKRFKEKRIEAELVFVDIGEGFVQRVPVNERHLEMLARQRQEVAGFARFRWRSRQRLREICYSPPFATLRPGQKEAMESLERLTHQSKVVFFEAPTGFGKTGAALDLALRRLREEQIDRVLYMTGKSTGQLQTVRQLAGMLEEGGGVHYVQVRNRSEHGIPQELKRLSATEQEKRWRKSGIAPATLFEDGTVALERVRELGERAKVSPYEITRALLPYAELWIGDYNYVFSPSARSFFENQPGYEPERTLLLVDEAHNLPARVAGALSLSLAGEELEQLFTHLQFAGVPSGLRVAVDHFAAFVLDLPRNEGLDLTDEYELLDLCEAVTEQLQKGGIDYEAVDEEQIDLLFSIAGAKEFIRSESLERLIWSPAPGRVNLTCLDASAHIAGTLRGFGQVVMMSATLSPFTLLRQAMGLDGGECAFLPAAAPWREMAYEVAVDVRVDTRLKSRERHFQTTAETVEILCHGAADPVAVFFPSYRYAESVQAYLQALDPALNALVQPRGLPLDEQDAFIGEALISAHAIFFVLGGSFSEGVDMLGGRISRAMVVGPALPEVDAPRRAMLAEREPLGRRQAFREVFLAPGMIKINQALGRLVRAPGQSAKVLLHCKRFAETDVKQLLAPEYRAGETIRDSARLLAWLSG